MLNYPEESINSNYTGNKSKWNSDSTTDISDHTHQGGTLSLDTSVYLYITLSKKKLYPNKLI